MTENHKCGSAQKCQFGDLCKPSYDIGGCSHYKKKEPITNEKFDMCVIRKNCMEEIANIYGLKLCEDFILESDSGYTVGVFKIDKCGLWKYDKKNMCYYAWHDVINRILDGSWGVRKMTNEEIVKEALNCGEK